MVKVKICGLTDPDMVGYTARAGADWIGFNFAPGSPRRITPEAAASLLLQVGDARPVGLMVDPDDAMVDQISALGFPVLQLHGSETPARVAAIKARTGLEIWKVIGVSGAADLTAASDFKAADRLLIDARAPEGAAYAGGHGVPFDWSLLDRWTPPRPWLLAGGLTPENVGEAISRTGAPAVDVSSGVERRRGLKDRALISAFIAAAKRMTNPDG